MQKKPTDSEIRAKLRKYIQEKLQEKEDTKTFSDSDSLFIGSGRLDSLDAMGIVILLESEYRVDFRKTGFDLELIDSVDAMIVLIAEK